MGKGLYEKYRVSRVDGRDEDYHADYFVLELISDKHARAAMLTYAKSCKEEKPLLAAEILLNLRQHTGEQS